MFTKKVTKEDSGNLIYSETGRYCSVYSTADDAELWKNGLDILKEFDLFTTRYRITWHRGLLLKGSATLIDGYQQWGVVTGLADAEMLALFPGDRTLDLKAVEAELKNKRLYAAYRPGQKNAAAGEHVLPGVHAEKAERPVRQKITAAVASANAVSFSRMWRAKK